MFRPLAYTKTYAMAAAALLSITLVPVLMGYFVRGRLLPQHRNPLNRLLVKLYEPVINAVLSYPRTVIGGAVMVMVVGLWPATQLGSEFMPELDEGDWMYMPITRPAISIDKVRELLQQTDRLIKTVPEVARVFGKAGRAETATDPAPLTMIETIIQFKPRQQWRPGMTPEKLRQELDGLVQLPGLTNTWVMPIKTRIDMLATGIKTPVGVKVAGPDLATIQVIGQQLETVLAALPGTTTVYSERVMGGRYVEVRIDRARAARYGLNIADVQDVVRSAIGGVTLTQTVEGLERYPVNLRYPQPVRDSVERLQLLPVMTPAGSHIALADVAEIVVTEGPAMIKSENARLNGWVYIDVQEQDLGSYVVEAQARVAAELDLPTGYSLSWSGQYEYLERAKQRLTLVGPVTLAIIILLLYLCFRRLAEVVMILGTLPMALVGGVWLLYLLDYQLSVAVAVGFIALAGVAVETGVVMLVYLNQALAKAQNAAGRPLTIEELRQAVINGAARRVRPITMTVAATVIGLLPVMLGSGTGSELMHGGGAYYRVTVGAGSDSRVISGLAWPPPWW